MRAHAHRHPEAAVNPVRTHAPVTWWLSRVFVVGLVAWGAPRGARAEEPAVTPSETTQPVEVPATETPPAETPPADAAPAEDAPATEEAPPETPSAPPLVEPSAPLQRWLRDRASRVDEPGAAASTAPPPAAAPAPAAQPGARPRVTLQLRDGRSVEGDVVSESPEGWALRLPTGETRFFDRLDVVADNAPSKARPGWAQKAVLLASLAWPGAGQVIYGAMVQHGQVWERSALVVGTILSAVAIASGVVVVAGVILGFALTAQAQAPAGLELAGPLNPITFAGILGVVLAFSVGVLDAGARALLD